MMIVVMTVVTVHQNRTGHNGLHDRNRVDDGNGLVHRDGLVLDDRGVVDNRFHDRCMMHDVVPGAERIVKKNISGSLLEKGRRETYDGT